MKLKTIGRLFFAAGALAAGIYTAYLHGQNNSKHITFASENPFVTDNASFVHGAEKQTANKPLEVFLPRGKDKKMQVFSFSAGQQKTAITDHDPA